MKIECTQYVNCAIEPEMVLTIGVENFTGGIGTVIFVAFISGLCRDRAYTATQFALLTALSPIWPSDNVIGDRPVGDCWRHEAVAGPGLSNGWMPLHKLSQWLTYSLVEPFAAGGVTVTGLDRLTGLAEYRAAQIRFTSHQIKTNHRHA